MRRWLFMTPDMRSMRLRSYPAGGTIPPSALFQSHVVPLERMPDVGLWLSASRLRERGGNNGFFQAQGAARAAKSTFPAAQHLIFQSQLQTVRFFLPAARDLPILECRFAGG